ncbi:MAG: single-stranded DNA-binding protein [Bacteroidales bacterium]
MSSLNKVMLIGNVGKDPEIRYLEGNVGLCRFSMATSDSYRNKNGENVTQTEWHNIVCWRGLAEVAQKFVKKGSQIYIEGKITTRSYDDKDGNKRYTTDIVASNLVLLGKRAENAPGEGEARSTGTSQPDPGQYADPTADLPGGDDLPF